MPDPVPTPPAPCPCSWMDKAKAIAIVIGAVGAGIVAPIIGVLNHTQNADNHRDTTTKIAATETKVDAAAVVAADVKKELMYTTERTEKKLDDTHAAVKAVGQKTDEVKAALPPKK